MSAERPVNVADMIAWLRAHPGEPFFSLWSRDRLLIGTRNDTGEICAWDCDVQASKMEYDRRASPAPETRTADPRVETMLRVTDEALARLGAPETRTGEGAGADWDSDDLKREREWSARETPPGGCGVCKGDGSKPLRAMAGNICGSIFCVACSGTGLSPGSEKDGGGTT